MSEIDELLNSEMEHIESKSMVNDEILVNPITRMMDVPISERLFGVVEDANVEKKYFRCPRYVGDDIDLSKLKIYMKYVHAIGNTPEEWEDTIPQFTWCDDVKVDGDDIVWTWKLSANVFTKKGFMAFAMVAKDENTVAFNTYPAIGTVLTTIPYGSEEISTMYPDIVTQLLRRMDSVEAIATPEAMQNYVNTYLEANPLQLDETLKDDKKAAPANIVGELKEDVTYLCNYEKYNYLRNYRSVHTRKHNGITFALQDDGSYDVSGMAIEDALFNFVLNTEKMPDWIRNGEWLEIKNSSKIVNLVLWYYDENMKYIAGPEIPGNYYSKVPNNAESVILRLKVKKGESVNENVKVAIFRNIEGRRLIASSDNAVLMEDVKDMIHINKVVGQGTLKIGNSNIFEITEENKTGNGVIYEYDSSIGEIKVSSSGAIADGIETVFTTQKSGSVSCHFAFKASKKMWLTFQSNPNEWMSFDSGVMYQIYRNGKMIGYERGLGYSFLANKGDEYGFRIIVTKGWSGNIIFKPQLNIGKEALDYEVCCTKTYKEDTVPDDISVGNMVSIINTECTYEFAYETKEVKEKKDTKRNGMISFIDDDTTSCKYVKDYHDIFEGTGVCGTYAVMTRRMTDGGTDPEDSSYHYRYDDEGELLELLKTYEMEGFGMVLHCYWQNDTHESTRYFNLATRDIQKCRENILRGLREYRELGFQNADLWVTPYGVQDTEIQNLAKELGLECLISMSNNTIISEDYRNRWCIPRYSISTTSDQDYLKEQMRTAVEKGGWINIVTHANSWKSADYEMMKNKVREIIAYAKEIGLEIGTFGKCYNEWKSALYEKEA